MAIYTIDIPLSTNLRDALAALVNLIDHCPGLGKVVPSSFQISNDRLTVNIPGTSIPDDQKTHLHIV